MKSLIQGFNPSAILSDKQKKTDYVKRSPSIYNKVYDLNAFHQF